MFKTDMHINDYLLDNIFLNRNNNETRQYKESNKMKLYKVGGCIRDQILGKVSNDIDYSCEADSYNTMLSCLKKDGYDIILEKPGN